MTDQAPKTVRVGIGRFYVDMPVSAFSKTWDVVKPKLGLTLVALLTVVNSVSEFSGEPSFAFLEDKDVKVAFSRTYLFWTPLFNEEECGSNFENAQRIFHKRLETMFGGWTRWKVNGSDSDDEENGWLYQTSLPKTSPGVEPNDLETLIREVFLQNTVYIIHIPHK